MEPPSRCIRSLTAAICGWLLLISACVCSGKDPTACTLQSGTFCVCDMADGSGTIDLTAISKSGGTPYFHQIKGDSHWKYDYDPCAPFQNNKCKDNCLVCQGGDSTCGRSTSIQIEVTGRNPDKGTLKYGNGDDLFKTPRTAVVTFTCDQSTEGELKFHSEKPHSQYNFDLTSKHTCIKPPAPPPSTTKSTAPPAHSTTKPQRLPNKRHVSLGTIMCIGLLVVVIIYLSAGFAFMFVKRQARGREAIPNYEFWIAVPGLVKEGAMFIVEKVNTLRGGRRSSYDAL